MLNHEEKVNVEFAPVNININAAKAQSASELVYLQKQRTKANKSRKPVYQAKIDAHFGLK